MTRLDSVERAVADIAAGKAVVVIDDEDRENEGDLIFAAEKATPELVAFMVRYTSGYLCVPLDGDDLRPARPAADVRGEPGQARHRLHRHGRREKRCRNRYFGVRPGHHHAAAGRPDQHRQRIHQARPRRAVARQGRRRAAPSRAHRGRRRPGPAGRPAARGRDLRDRQPEGRGRDGADRRAAGVRRRAQPGADLHRRPDRVASQAREAHRAHRRGPHPDPARRVPGSRLHQHLRRRRARRAGPRRHRRTARRRPRRPGARALGVPDR